MKSVSVIVPIYNSEKYLAKCIDSLLNQSISNIEIILVDDGSSDNSLKICEEKSKNDKRIKVISQNNMGVSEARNTGISAATGKYIMFCDSDDYVEKNWCEELLSSIYGDKKIFGMCGYSIISSRKRQCKILEIVIGEMNSITSLEKKDFWSIYINNISNSPCNKIFITKIIRNNNIKFNKKLSLGEDILFNLEYMKYIDQIKVVNKTLYNYVQTDDESLDNKYYKNLFDMYIGLYDELQKYMLEFKVDIKKEEESFYRSYFYMLNRVLNNTFNKKCKLSVVNKFKYNSNILKSKEFKLCLEKADLSGFNEKYIKLLKSERYILVYIFNKLALIKEKITR